VLPTPFTGAGDVDLPSITRVVDLVVKSGVNGMTALGVTGEVSRLTERERGQIVEAVVKAAGGRAKVIVGASADGVRTCIEYTREAGARRRRRDVSPPRMLKLNTESVVSHYKALAEAVDLPIVVQDYPPISGFAIEAGLLARIAREVPSAGTIKLEDPPTPFKTTRILAAAKETKVAILGGLGGVFLMEELMAGAAGVMTGFAYPEVLVKVVSLYRSGKMDEAADVFYRFVPLMRFEFQEGIGMAIRKEVFKRRGVLADAATRAPGPTLDEHPQGARLCWRGPQNGKARHGSWTEGKVAMLAGAPAAGSAAVARALAAEGVKVSISSRNEAAVSEAAKRSRPRPTWTRSRRPRT
jgi:4-hydroxy-tetrahydrodipicolinate synthase